MRSSHNLAAEPTPAHVQLQEFLAERSRSTEPVSDVEQFERDLRTILNAVHSETVAEEVARFDVDVPVLDVEGIAHRQVVRCEQTYLSAAGPMRIMRSLYSTREDGERAVCPMELKAGIVEGYWTPLAAQHATWVVTHLTPQAGEDLFARFGGMEPSKSSLDRLPKLLSERWELGRKNYEEALREQERVPENAVTMAVSLDGVLLPMKDGDRQAKRVQAEAEGKLPRGPAGYKEASCGTLSFYDREGNRLATRRLARMPEHKKSTLKSMLMDEVKAVLAERPELQLVKVADGAKDNWTFLANELAPEIPGIEVADFYHAADHLHVALGAAYGETSPQCKAQFEKLRHILREDLDGAEKVIRALVHLRDRHPRRKKIATELKYFRANRHRMNYAELKAKNLPIGSGVVEAACKTLVTQRMKQSGMRWREEGGQAILTFRSLVQSDRFDRAWKLLARTYRATVTLPHKVTAMPRRALSV